MLCGRLIDQSFDSALKKNVPNHSSLATASTDCI